MSLISHYRLNGDANDSISGNDGLANAVSYVSGKAPLCGNFLPASGSYVEIPNGGQLFTSPKWSVSFWTNRRGGVNFSCEVAIDGGWYLRFRPDTLRIEARVWTDISGDSGNVNCGSFTFNRWYHVAMTFDGITVKVYVDGILVKQFEHPGVTSQNTNPMLLGGCTSPGQYLMDGRLENVRIYDHVLSSYDVYWQSKGLVADYDMSRDDMLDKEGNSTVTVMQAMCQYDADLNRNVITFDGRTDPVVVTSPLGQRGNDQVWTVEFYIKSFDNSRYQIMFRGFNSGLNLSHVGNRRLLLYLNSGVNDYYTYGPILPNDTWSHLIYTFNNATGYREIFLNGRKVSSGGPNKTSTPSGIGAEFKIGYAVLGRCAMIRVYNTEFTEQDAKDRFRTLLALDDQGVVHTGFRRYVKKTPTPSKLLDYREWSPPSGIGDVGSFSTVATQSNRDERLYVPGPDNVSRLVWQTKRMTNSSDNGQGGFESKYIEVDCTDSYRFSVWIRHMAGTGTKYLGLRGRGGKSGVWSISAQSVNTNPYFKYEGFNGANGPWELWVGVLHHRDYLGGMDPVSGVYQRGAGKVRDTISDFRMLANTREINLRAYLYYSQVGATQQFLYPRIDKLDGTEPTISQLLNMQDTDIVDVQPPAGDLSVKKDSIHVYESSQTIDWSLHPDKMLVRKDDGFVFKYPIEQT